MALPMMPNRSFTQPGTTTAINSYNATQSNAAGLYNSMFSGGGGNPNGVYNKPGSMASALRSNAAKPVSAQRSNQMSPDQNEMLMRDMEGLYQAMNGRGNNPNQGVPSSFLSFYNQPGGFNPFSFGMGMDPGALGVNYSGQNPNLGRYVPPMMYGTGTQANPANWMNSGGYAYNSPNSYGSAGVFNYPMWG